MELAIYPWMEQKKLRTNINYGDKADDSIKLTDWLTERVIGS